MQFLFPPDHVAPLLDDDRDCEHEPRAAVLDRLENSVWSGRGGELYSGFRGSWVKSV